MASPTQTFPDRPVLLVDDEQVWLTSFAWTLRHAGVTNLRELTDSRKVMPFLQAEPPSVVVLDLVMPHVFGEDLLKQIHVKYPDVPVIIFTGAHDVTSAVRCMKLGAYDYFVKTEEPARLVSGIRRAIELCQLREINQRLRDRVVGDSLEFPLAFAEIVTRDRAMRSVFRYVEAVARTIQPVLVTGESGTGKELIARALHDVSGRSGPFVAVNVAGLDEGLFSDALFGHVKGAFTGAATRRSGLVEQAAEGTLFLDEIGELDHRSQVKLLRLLQEREYYPLGSDRPHISRARVVVATNQDLEYLAESGGFRNDLYYRLATHHVAVPPLRQRLGDLPLLVARLLERAAQALGKPIPTPPPELIDVLRAYHFPGNVRELESMIFDAVSRHESRKLSTEPFRAMIRKRRAIEPGAETAGQSPLSFGQTLPTLKEAGDLLTQEAMRRSGGNQRVAAELLGITRQALNKRLRPR